MRDFLSFIARGAMHQNQWLAAIEELEEDGLEHTPVPSNFSRERELTQVAYQYLNFSEGTESQAGRWAQGPSADGRGELEYVASPRPMTDDEGLLGLADPRLQGTPPVPMPR